MQLLPRLSAAASGRLRRGLSTAASLPPWAMIQYTRIRASSAERASIELAKPPDVSHLVVPEHLVGLDPELPVDPNSDILGAVFGSAGATSDGLVLLDFIDIRATARVVANRRASAQAQAQQSKKLTGLSFNLYNSRGDTQERELAGVNMNPDITRLVCNPITGELFRLPDIDGTKKTMFRGCDNAGLLTRSAAGHGPPDSYAVAVLGEDRDGGTFNMRRFLSRNGKWEKLVGLPSPLPLPRRMAIYTEAAAFAGRLWWADLTWGVVSADPFSDWPELHFVELRRGSVWPVPSTDLVQEQGMHRRLGVSEGRLRYVEVSQKDPFVLSSFALDDDGSGWRLEHEVALGRICEVKGGGPWDTPRIAVIDPLNASVLYHIVGKHVLGVDMDMGKVMGCSLADETEGPAYAITSVLKPCVLPPWLSSSKIPAAGTFSRDKGDAKSKTLSDILVRADSDKR